MKNSTKQTLRFLTYSQLTLLPSLLFAQDLSKLIIFVEQFGRIVAILFPIVFGLAFLFFMWGVAVFILNSGDPKLLEDGKQRLIWGSIGMVVIISIYGIVLFINDAIGIQPVRTAPFPCPPGNIGGC